MLGEARKMNKKRKKKKKLNSPGCMRILCVPQIQAGHGCGLRPELRGRSERRRRRWWSGLHELPRRDRRRLPGTSIRTTTAETNGRLPSTGLLSP